MSYTPMKLLLLCVYDWDWVAKEHNLHHKRTMQPCIRYVGYNARQTIFKEYRVASYKLA